MHPIKQLLRQPVRVIAVMILLAFSSAFLSVGWGLYRSVEATAENIESSFVTSVSFSSQYRPSLWNFIEYDPVTYIVTSSEYEEVILDPNIQVNSDGSIGLNGLTKEEAEASMPRVSDFLDALAACPAIKGIYRQHFSSAYCPQITAAISYSRSGDSYDPLLDVPYNNAVAVIKVTDIHRSTHINSGYTTAFDPISQKMQRFQNVYYDVRGEIIEFPARSPGYSSSVCTDVVFSVAQQLYENGDVLNEIPCEVGKTYAVVLHECADKDLLLRKQEAFMINNNPNFAPAEPVTAESLNWDEVPFVLSASERDDINAFYGELYNLTDVYEMTGSLEELLADPANKGLADNIENYNRQYHCVSVIGTDELDSIHIFHDNTAFVSEGRSFEPEDYTEGRNVCLISESVAQSSGLSVGDKIDLEFYGTYDSNAEEFSQKTGDGDRADLYMYSTKIEKTSEYEIIGIYRNTNQWRASAYDFSPNSVFVPNGSLAGVTTGTNSGKMLSMVAENGRTDEIVSFLEENGWNSEMLVFDDEGYAEISGALAAMKESAIQMLAASAATFIVIAAAYIALFVMKQRRNAGLMLSLGSGKSRTARFVLTVSLIPALIASVAGSVAGALLLGRVVKSVYANVAESSDSLAEGVSSTVGSLGENLVINPLSVIAVFAAAAAAYLILLLAVSAVLSRKKPLALMKK